MGKKVKIPRAKNLSRRKKIIIAIIILFIVVAIVFLGFYLFSDYFKNEEGSKSNGTTSTSLTSATGSDLSTEAVAIAAESGYEAGQEYLDQALESASASSDKATIYLYKASLANSNKISADTSINSDDSGSTTNVDGTGSGYTSVVPTTETALEYAYKAEELSPSAASAITIASLEETIGNLENAIKYYKIYLERGANSYDATNQDSDYDYYSNYIKELKVKL